MKGIHEEMKKRICVLFILLVMSVLDSMAVCAKESGASDLFERNGFGNSVKNPDKWEGLKGTLFLLPASQSSICDDPEVFASEVIYFPATEQEMKDEGTVMALSEKMAVPGLIFTIKGDIQAILEVIPTVGLVDPADEETLDDSLVQIGEADGYEFFLFNMLDEEYADSLDEEYAQEYRNLPSLIEKEMKQAAFCAPVDPMKALVGQTISFTSTDLDGNTLTSEELFKDNEITMYSICGVCGALTA